MLPVRPKPVPNLPRHTSHPFTAWQFRNGLCSRLSPCSAAEMPFLWSYPRTCDACRLQIVQRSPTGPVAQQLQLRPCMRGQWASPSVPAHLPARSALPTVPRSMDRVSVHAGYSHNHTCAMNLRSSPARSPQRPDTQPGPAVLTSTGALTFGEGAARRRRQLVCAAAPDDTETVDVGAPERLITSVGLGLLWAAALCERL